jgi:DNA-binding PadR family transcriptional regulator
VRVSRSSIGELSASMAVLGLVIEEPKDASCVAQRLSERFRPARFAPSTAHMTLPRLEAQGLVRRVPRSDASDSSQGRYEATEEGIEHFRRWLRTSPAVLPPLREALHARIDLSQPADLERVIEITDRERRACEREYAAACGRLTEARQVVRFKGSNADWSELVREVVMVDEAMIWAYRGARLERLHARLEDLRTRHAENSADGEAQLAS